MKKKHSIQEQANVLICTMCTLLVVSFVGANVLMNCTTRYNVTSRQVKAWKEALIAAEAGADVGYAECRKTALTPGTQFTAGGWAAPSPAPANPTWSKSVSAFGQNGSLTSQVTVDRFWVDTNGGPYYRIRSTGVARVFGLVRTGMDDRMSATTRGDSLLRKIDFKTDHFIATYGDGDGNGLAVTPVPNPQISRRVELVAAPLDAFEGAVKCLQAFFGPGSSSVIDSYDSHNGPYYFAADDPSDPHYADARNGNVAVNTPTFTEGGPIYGDVGTNGGTITHSGTQISGNIDNTISFTCPPVTQPSPPSGTSYQPGSPKTISPTATATSPSTPDWYLYPDFNDITINARKDASGHPLDTYVTVVVTGDIGGNGNPTLTIAKGVNAKIYFTGNFSLKASKMDNNNVDGAAGVYAYDGNPTSTTPSTIISRAAHVQFYGINPPAGQTQTIDTNPGGAGGGSGAQMWAVFYAPGADFYMHGNPDLFGAVVCKTFYGNGNCGFHYDKALQWTAGPPVEYRIASFVEDTR
jgi:hypothetical protein